MAIPLWITGLAPPDSRAVAAPSRLPTATGGSVSSYTTSRGTTGAAPADRLAPMWKVRWWRDYGRTIGDAELLELGVPASLAAVVGVPFVEIARTLPRRLDGGRDRARACRAAGVTAPLREVEPGGLVMAAVDVLTALGAVPGSGERSAGGGYRRRSAAPSDLRAVSRARAFSSEWCFSSASLAG